MVTIRNYGSKVKTSHCYTALQCMVTTRSYGSKDPLLYCYIAFQLTVILHLYLTNGKRKVIHSRNLCWPRKCNITTTVIINNNNTTTRTTYLTWFFPSVQDLCSLCLIGWFREGRYEAKMQVWPTEHISSGINNALIRRVASLPPSRPLLSPPQYLRPIWLYNFTTSFFLHEIVILHGMDPMKRWFFILSWLSWVSKFPWKSIHATGFHTKPSVPGKFMAQNIAVFGH